MTPACVNKHTKQNKDPSIAHKQKHYDRGCRCPDSGDLKGEVAWRKGGWPREAFWDSVYLWQLYPPLSRWGVKGCQECQSIDDSSRHLMSLCQALAFPAVTVSQVPSAPTTPNTYLYTSRRAHKFLVTVVSDIRHTWLVRTEPSLQRTNLHLDGSLTTLLIFLSTAK